MKPPEPRKSLLRKLISSSRGVPNIYSAECLMRHVHFPCLLHVNNASAQNTHGTGAGERGSVGAENDKVTPEACGSGATLRKKPRNELRMRAGQMRGALKNSSRCLRRKRGGKNEAACPGDGYLLSSGMRKCFCMNTEKHFKRLT